LKVLCTLRLDVHRSVHHNTNLIEMTNKLQLCRTVYYSIVPWLLNMYRAILSLIIRSFETIITASGFTQVCRYRPLSWLSGNWLKPVSTKQLNNKLSYTVASCWSFYKIFYLTSLYLWPDPQRYLCYPKHKNPYYYNLTQKRI